MTPRARVPLLLAIASLSLPGCMVGPNYRRPEVPTPPQYRFVEGPAQAESIADLPWWEVARDPQLQALLREAIANNLDLRVATARVEEARAVAGIARSFLYPDVGVSAGYGAEQASRDSDPPRGQPDGKHYQNWDGGFTLSWEIDLFGRRRRENEAAFASYLATEQGRRGVLVTLVADVASTYFRLLQLDAQLQVARDTLKSNDDTVAFYRLRLDGGVSNRLEVDSAVSNRARTATAIPDLRRQIAITENALSLLLGRTPGPVPRGEALGDQSLPPEVPAGLPATLLERRPDVVAAEQLLVSSNANVGAARALFFPTLSLTGALGTVSGEFSSLLSSDSNVWSLGGGLFQPLFQGGRIKRNYEAAQARFEQAMAVYRRAALNGYREVADALVTRQSLADQRQEIALGVEALQDAGELARARYDNGLSSYLEILIADQNLFDQQILLAQTQGAELQAFVQLYRALGGGWQPEPQKAATGAASSP